MDRIKKICQILSDTSEVLWVSKYLKVPVVCVQVSPALSLFIVIFYLLCIDCELSVSGPGLASSVPV